MNKLVDRAALRELGITFSNMHLLRLERRGAFPERLYLSPKKIAWPAEEIAAWIEQHMAARPLQAQRSDAGE